MLGDADLDVTADDIVAGAFSYSGQRCTAVKRVLAVESVADELVGWSRGGLASSPSVIHGTTRRSRRWSTSARRRGPTRCRSRRSRWARARGRRRPQGKPGGADAGRPRHLGDGPRLGRAVRTGPADDPGRRRRAAVKLANDSEYGLQAAIFSRNVDAAMTSRSPSTWAPCRSTADRPRTGPLPVHRNESLGNGDSGCPLLDRGHDPAQGDGVQHATDGPAHAPLTDHTPHDLGGSGAVPETTGRDDRPCTIPEPRRAARCGRSRRTAGSCYGSRCATARRPSSGSRPGSGRGHTWDSSTASSAKWCGPRA